MKENVVSTGFDEVIENPDAVWRDPEDVVGPAGGVVSVVMGAPLPAPPARPANFPEITPIQLVGLAREVAYNIREIDDIIAIYKVTREQYDWLAEHHEFFKHALHLSKIEWSSSLKAAERVQLESLAILEDALPRLGARMVNQAEGLPGVVEAAKLFAKLAGVGEKEVGDRTPGEKFQININLGGDDKLVYKSKETPTIEGSTSKISINTEGM